jgi:uncharacterized membrane-anchored protein
MLRLTLALLLAAIPIAGFAQPTSQEQYVTEFRNLPWQRGPASADVGGKATIKLGPQDAFLGDQGTKKLLALMGNPARDGHYALVPTTAEDWVGVFTFNPTGYVKDDDKIDADALLAQLKKNDEASNEERKRLGLPELHLIGWQVSPHYDPSTKHLEWGTRLRDERGNIVVNYTARLLGRTGVMNAILVSNPDTLDADRKAFAKRLEGFQFAAGERYSEFREGDKVAGYGLAALIVGGAAAVATKKGLWAVIGGFLAASWKIVTGVVVAAFAGLGKLFKTKKQ